MRNVASKSPNVPHCLTHMPIHMNTQAHMHACTHKHTNARIMHTKTLYSHSCTHTFMHVAHRHAHIYHHTCMHTHKCTPYTHAITAMHVQTYQMLACTCTHNVHARTRSRTHNMHTWNTHPCKPMPMYAHNTGIPSYTKHRHAHACTRARAQQG